MNFSIDPKGRTIKKKFNKFGMGLRLSSIPIGERLNNEMKRSFYGESTLI